MSSPVEQGAAGGVADVLAEVIATDRMRHYGYTDAEIEAASIHPIDHEAAGCAYDSSYGWDCRDEDDRPQHAEADEMERTAEFVMWVLEHPALQPYLEAEVARRVDAEKATAVEEALAQYTPQVWEAGRVAGVVDALRAHGPSDEGERLLWVVMTPPTDANPYEGEPFDFEAHAPETAEEGT